MASFFALSLLGISGGAAVGAALLAVYSIFDFASVLRRYSTNKHFDSKLEIAITLGTAWSAVFYLYKKTFLIPKLCQIAIGFLFGCFIGLLTASLSDVIGIIPVLRSKRKGNISVPLLLCMLSLGRAAGSLFFFFFWDIQK